jgi:hypothetical protein
MLVGREPLAGTLRSLAGRAREVLDLVHMFSADQSLGGPLGILCLDSLALLLRR